MNEAEKEKRIAEIIARRKARGMADPLNRLSAYIAKAIASGEEVAINIPAKEQ